MLDDEMKEKLDTVFIFILQITILKVWEAFFCPSLESGAIAFRDNQKLHHEDQGTQLTDLG